MPTEEEIAASRSKHPTHGWTEDQDYGKRNPIEMHPGFNGVPLPDRRPKGLRIVEECEETGEPYFVFRAKDVLGIFILVEYARLIELYRPTAFDMAEGVANARNSFLRWMDENPTAVHLPD